MTGVGRGILPLVILLAGSAFANAQSAVDLPSAPAARVLTLDDVPEMLPAPLAPARVEAPPVHVVQRGETLYRIAKRYGVGVPELRRANGLKSNRAVPVGARLKLPVRPPEPEPLVPPARTLLPTPLPGATESGWAWPLLPNISSMYGLRHNRLHAGLDLLAPTGTAIIASRGGTVVRASRYYGYGNLVVIDHGDGTQSWYAHLSRIIARAGEAVSQGDTLGLAGATGKASAPHLHFEIRQDGAPVDPLVWLPPPPEH